jgi:pyruvate/2-oxoglutarate dehydrogenase complex dihydrolipoamide dehydrogenase (E3) component
VLQTLEWKFPWWIWQSVQAGFVFFRGCIPSKTYLYLSELIHDARRAESMGGLELGSVYAALGSQVTVAELGGRLLPGATPR